ncbi:MAG: YlbF family regulator [Thermacetogeniaceae bacterium]
MSSIIEKAHDLGHELSESDEAVVLHAAEMNMEQDGEAQALITDFQTRHKKNQEAEQANKEVSDEEWNEFNRIQEKMKENKTIQAYFAGMQRFQKLLQDVNAEINKVLTGGDACSPSECDSCSLDCKQ